MIIDRVDRRDHRVGTIRRAQVFQEKANFRVAHVFVFDSNGRLLLQQLGRNRERHSLYWGSSVAAYLFSEETYRQAALRRLKEEIGLVNLSMTSLGKTSMVDAGCKKFITLYVSKSDGPFFVDQHHIETVRFFGLDVIDSMMNRGRVKFTPTFRHLFEFFRRQA